jgi:hypothetical protein
MSDQDNGQALVDQLEREVRSVIERFLDAPDASFSMVAYIMTRELLVAIIGDSDSEDAARARLGASIKLLRDGVNHAFIGSDEEPS